MTEAEWLECDEPEAMLDWLTRNATPRKLRLLWAGVARYLWGELRDERSQQAVETAESHADGEASTDQLIAASWKAERARAESWSSLMLHARTFAAHAAWWYGEDEPDGLNLSIRLLIDWVQKGEQIGRAHV